MNFPPTTQIPGQDLTLQSEYRKGMIAVPVKKIRTGIFNA
jgi:hypothetical protein